MLKNLGLFLQNDASAVCFPVLGQDVPSSLYGFPQGQPVGLGHSAFAAVIHPAHSAATAAAATHPLPPPLLPSMAGAADIMGSLQMNWANNY